MNLESEIKTVLENVACLGRDAYGKYIEDMTAYLLKKIAETEKTKNTKTVSEFTGPLSTKHLK